MDEETIKIDIIVWILVDECSTMNINKSPVISFHFNVFNMVEDGTKVHEPFVVTMDGKAVSMSWEDALKLWIASGKTKEEFVNLST